MDLFCVLDVLQAANTEQFQNSLNVIDWAYIIRVHGKKVVLVPTCCLSFVSNTRLDNRSNHCLTHSGQKTTTYAPNPLSSLDFFQLNSR